MRLLFLFKKIDECKGKQIIFVDNKYVISFAEASIIFLETGKWRIIESCIQWIVCLSFYGFMKVNLNKNTKTNNNNKSAIFFKFGCVWWANMLDSALICLFLFRRLHRYYMYIYIYRWTGAVLADVYVVLMISHCSHAPRRFHGETFRKVCLVAYALCIWYVGNGRKVRDTLLLSRIT